MMLRFSRKTDPAEEPGEGTVEPATSPASRPNHIAIIMDGNGRWARQHHLPRIAGHRKGAEALRNVLEHCRHKAIPYLTVYAFSSENWERPADEVQDLMQLLKTYLHAELDTLISNEIRLHIIGDRQRLPKDICHLIQEAEAKTATFSEFTLTICLSYGARQELVHATRDIAREVAEGTLAPEHINTELIEERLYTSALPDPDLLIRTGGEKRLSNFLLWQSAYTELFFTETLWPDFAPADLDMACIDYARRERRYGKRND